jgi:hypothetical protein
MLEVTEKNMDFLIIDHHIDEQESVIADFPKEMLYKIFEEFEERDDIFHFSCVNNHWRVVAFECYFMKKFFLSFRGLEWEDAVYVLNRCGFFFACRILANSLFTLPEPLDPGTGLNLNNLVGAVITLDLFEHPQLAQQVYMAIFSKLVRPHIAIHIKLKAVWHLMKMERFNLIVQFVNGHEKSHPILKHIGDMLYDYLNSNEKLKQSDGCKQICSIITDVYTKYLYYGDMEDCYETLVGDIIVFRRLTEIYCLYLRSLDNPSIFLKAAEIADMLIKSSSKTKPNSTVIFNDLLLVCNVYKELLVRGKLFENNQLDNMKNKAISYLKKTQDVAKNLNQTEFVNTLSSISTKLEQVDLLAADSLNFWKNDSIDNHKLLETH